MQVDLSPWLKEEFVLDARKAVYWPAQAMLIVSDWHLGKVSHFRKNGIGVPSHLRFKGMIDFDSLMKDYRPQQVVFLGDLFHSDYNLEWEEFGRFISGFEGVDFTLVEGNHDILHPAQYAKFGITVKRGIWKVGNVVFSHEPLEDEFEGYNLCGHIHPGVRMTGKGKQSIRLSCFHFTKQQGILPAFGEFTGKYVLKPKKSDRVFVCADKQVVEVGLKKN